MHIQPITSATDLKGKRVLVRGNLNVPVKQGKVVDGYRIEMLLPTLMFLRDAGAKIILCGHLGRDATVTLEPIARYLQEYIPIIKNTSVFDPAIHDTIAYMAPGTILLLENLRQYEGEKNNDPAFAKHLASLADIFVQDDFSVCHRNHASVVGVPALLPKYGGIQLLYEVEHLSKAFTPEHPFLFIIGGAKVETKMPLLERFKDSADTLFVGGVLANDCFKAMGQEIGVSHVSDHAVPKTLLENQKIMLPSDVVVLRNGNHVQIPHDTVLAKDAIFDAGRKTIKTLTDEIKRARYIIWNGPLGYCEEGFSDATLAIAEAIAESNAYSVVGGGDTLAAIPADVQMKFTFVSTGGGAMLDFLAQQTLPGLCALEV